MRRLRRLGILAGAKVHCNAATRPDVITICKRYSIPIFSGALTPTEIVAAWEAGSDAVKIFPAEFFGPAYIKSVKAPLNHYRLCPDRRVNDTTWESFSKPAPRPPRRGVHWWMRKP